MEGGIFGSLYSKEIIVAAVAKGHSYDAVVVDFFGSKSIIVILYLSISYFGIKMGGTEILGGLFSFIVPFQGKDPRDL